MIAASFRAMGTSVQVTVDRPDDIAGSVMDYTPIMVAPEGQLGEAFHLLPLSRTDDEGNGL